MFLEVIILRQKVTIWIFFTMLFVGMVCFFVPTASSENEESAVAYSIPTASGIANKNHISNTESYLSNRFAIKTIMLQIKTRTLLSLGQKEANGIYMSDSRLIEIPDLPAEETTENMIGSVKSISEQYKLPVYFMLIPTAAEVYKDDLPHYLSSVDELGYIGGVYDELTKNGTDSRGKEITTLDAAMPLAAAKAEQIFYNTDRRITSVGAYRIYSSTAKAMGLTSTTLLNYNIEHISYSFKGDLFNKTRLSGVSSDSINLYHYTGNSRGISVTIRSGIDKVTESKSLYYRDKIGTSDEAAVFLGGNKPYVNISVYNNANKNILIFSDENIGTFTQFLVPHYKRITIVNLNYISKYYGDYINIEDYDYVMFMYSLATLKDGMRFSNLDILS